MNKYSIIIPIFNEVNHIAKLLKGVKIYKEEGHEIIIVDDGSNDGTYKELTKYNFIKLIKSNTNQGKGNALKKGLALAKNNYILIFDGDNELPTNQIRKLMILNEVKGIRCVLSTRFSNEIPLNNFWNFGNFFLTILFNYVHKTNFPDALCCAKSFLKSDLKVSDLTAEKFDIDVEISSKLISKNKSNLISVVKINYNRRRKNEGKKLKLRDSMLIILKLFSLKLKKINHKQI